MLILFHGVRFNAHCYTFSEALYKRIAIHGVDIHGVKLCARWFTWSEASCLMLY